MLCLILVYIEYYVKKQRTEQNFLSLLSIVTSVKILNNKGPWKTRRLTLFSMKFLYSSIILIILIIQNNTFLAKIFFSPHSMNYIIIHTFCHCQYETGIDSIPPLKKKINKITIYHFTNDSNSLNRFHPSFHFIPLYFLFLAH